jgi:hypothetical protein
MFPDIQIQQVPNVGRGEAHKAMNTHIAGGLIYSGRNNARAGEEASDTAWTTCQMDVRPQR